MPEQNKKKKYKINYKRLGVLLGGLILLVVIIVGGVWFFGNYKEETKVYEALIQLKDQKSSNSEEDAKNSAKAGDVILIRESGREWSKTERSSYLILKIKLNENRAQKLTQSKTKKLTREEVLEKGIISEEILKGMEEEELVQMLTEDILFREYRVKIEELGFDFMKLRKKQPFEEEVFKWDIVERK